MIELAIDPAFDDALDVAEVGTPCCGCRGVSVRTSISAERVVAVRMLADAVVVEQAVAVAELDALGDEIH